MAGLDGRLGYARIAVAASREVVAGWAGPAQVPCRISTGRAGWVGVCLRDDGLGAVADDGREVEDVVRQLCVELGVVAVCVRLDGDALRIVGSRAGASAVQLTSPGRRGDGTIDLAASAALAALCGREGVAEDLLAVLQRRDLDGVHRHGALSELLGLPVVIVGDPPLGLPGAEAELAITPRLAPADVEFAAAVVKLDGWIVPLPGYTAIVGQVRGSDAGLLPVSMAVSTVRRRMVLHLWRAGTACGYLLVRNGKLRDRHAWGDAWLTVTAGDTGPEGLDEPPHGDARALARAFGRGDQEVALRALLRRAATPDQLLVELAELLGLPATIPRFLAGEVDPARFGTAYRAESKSVPRAVWDASRPVRDDHPWPERNARLPRFLVPSVLYWLLALSGISLVLDQAPSSRDYLLAAVPTLWAVSFTVATWLHWRRRRHPDGQRSSRRR